MYDLLSIHVFVQKGVIWVNFWVFENLKTELELGNPNGTT